MEIIRTEKIYLDGAERKVLEDTRKLFSKIRQAITATDTIDAVEEVLYSLDEFDDYIES